MGASATLFPPTLQVDPGGEAVCQVKVRNTGKVVDEFSLRVLGDAAGWARVEPSTLSLFPGVEGQADVRFAPPRSYDTTAGTVPFGVRVASREDPDGSVVEEGVVEVGRFADVVAELVPRTSRGRRSARHDLAVDNRGNTRINASLSARDPDNLLRFEMDPPALVAEPNTAVFTRIKVKPNRRFLRGPAKTHLFQVVVEPEGAAPLTADGTMLQEALTPRWLPMALLGLLGLVLLWFVLLQPTVKSAAREAVAAPLAKQGAKIADLEKKTTGTTAPVEGTTTTTTASGLAALGNPFDQRLALDAKADNGNDTEAFPIDEGRVFSLTDIVLQNPAGDAGALEVRRDDQVILRVNLSNFRDLDYHFVSSVVFQGGQDLVLFVQCGNPAGGPACTPAAYFAGFMKEPTTT